MMPNQSESLKGSYETQLISLVSFQSYYLTILDSSNLKWSIYLLPNVSHLHTLKCFIHSHYFTLPFYSPLFSFTHIFTLFSFSLLTLAFSLLFLPISTSLSLSLPLALSGLTQVNWFSSHYISAITENKCLLNMDKQTQEQVRKIFASEHANTSDQPSRKP